MQKANIMAQQLMMSGLGKIDTTAQEANAIAKRKKAEEIVAEHQKTFKNEEEDLSDLFQEPSIEEGWEKVNSTDVPDDNDEFVNVSPIDPHSLGWLKTFFWSSSGRKTVLVSRIMKFLE